MARSYNCPTYGGHVGRDAEEFSYGAGQTGATLSFAVGFSYKGRDGWINETFWIKTSVFGKQAKYVLENVRKGSYVVVTGPFSPRPYTKKNGQPGVSFEMRAQDIVVVATASDSGTTVVERIEDLPFHDDMPPF